MKVEIAAAPISKKMYVHDPTLPRSARIDSNSTIVVTNRNRVRFEKLRIDNQYDYEMNIDAAEVLPPTWKHAGLPPDGTFAPERKHDLDDPLRNLYSDNAGLAVLAMAACNLTMGELALSDNGRKPAEVKASLKPAKPLPPGESLTNFMRTENMQLLDELDEECIEHVLGMLVRLFYRDDGETGDRDWREQELRKAVILYMGGTGGTNQFTNFTSLLMSLELAVGFAKSKGMTSNDTAHKAAALLIDAIRWSGIDPTKTDSPLVKSCRVILGDAMAGRVYEYTKLNNRLKHYGSESQTEYFNKNVKGIHDLMRGLRVDAAYVILLGLTKLYGTGSQPARASKASRTSRVVLGMIEDCLDRRSADEVNGNVESKIQYLMDFIENDALKSEKFTYDNSRLVLCTFETLVKVARMLDTPGSLAGVRALARELKDVLPDNLEPSKNRLDVEHDEEALHTWLKFIAYRAVRWMDDQFHHAYVILHIAQHGRESEVKCDPDRF